MNEVEVDFERLVKCIGVSGSGEEIVKKYISIFSDHQKAWRAGYEVRIMLRKLVAENYLKSEDTERSRGRIDTKYWHGGRWDNLLEDKQGVRKKRDT